MSDMEPASKLRRQMLTAALAAGTAAPAVAVLSAAGSPQPGAMADNGAESIAASVNALQLIDYDALRAYAGPRKSTYVTGYRDNAVPSGIAGMFVADSHDKSSADNGGTVIVSRNGMRWKRQYDQHIHVDWFGAFGAADARPAWQAAIAVAEVMGGAFLTARSGACYVMAGGLRWNSCLVGANLNGATLDFTSMRSGVALAPYQSGVEINSRTGAAQIHRWADATLIGPGYAATKVVAMRIEQLNDRVNAGNTFLRMRFQKFAVDVQFGAGAFFTLFDACVFQGVPDAGRDTTYGLQMEAAPNAGEKNTFRDCLFGGRNYGLNHVNPNADTTFDNCRFDTFGHVAMLVSAGTVILSCPHIECESDVDYWFQCRNADSTLYVINAPVLTIGAVKSAFAPFYSDASCTNGGIVIDGMKTVFGKAVDTYLVAGAGRTQVRHIQWGHSAAKPVLSSYQNVFAYGTFESANFDADWVLAGEGGSVPGRVAEVAAHSGRHCLKFSGVSGHTISASAIFLCAPGQFATLEFWYMARQMMGSGATFFAQINYVDRKGSQVAGAQVMAVNNDVNAWQRMVGAPVTPAPPGTSGVQFVFSMFGVAKGSTPLGYIDDVVATVT